MNYGGTVAHSLLNSTKCNEFLLFQDYQLAFQITESQLIRINFYLLLSGFLFYTLKYATNTATFKSIQIY